MAGPLYSAHAIPKLAAQDLDRARRFYCDNLVSRPSRSARAGYATFAGQRSSISPSRPGRPPGGSTQIGFEVEDFDQVAADLRERDCNSRRSIPPALKFRAIS